MAFITPKLPKLDYSLYNKHIAEFAKLLQQALSKFNIIVKEPPLNTKISGGLLEKFNVNSGSIDGIAYPQQIKAFSSILNYLLRKDNEGKWIYVPNHIAISALTMSGKTGLINLGGCFTPPIIYLLTNVNETLCNLQRLLPNNIDLEKQANLSGGNFQELYQHVILQYKEEEITAWDYHERLHRLKNSGADTPLVGKGYRTSPSNRVVYKNDSNNCSEKGINLIDFVDESDARADSDSVMAEMVAVFDDKNEKWIADGCSFLALSATNDAFRAYAKQNGYPCIDMLPYGVQYEEDNDNKLIKPIYTGYSWINGRKLKNMFVPKVISFARFDVLTNSGLNKTGDPRQMLDFDCWKKHNRRGKEIDWVYARGKWIAAFVKAVKWCILSENPMSSKGMLARIVVKNSVMNCLVDLLQSKIPAIKVLLHNQSETKQFIKGQKCTVTLEEHIEQECGPELNRQPYIVIVTGKGRRGSIAPKDCKIGMDFARKSEPNPMLQGIAGRLTGYFKDITMVILSSYNTELLTHYIATGTWKVNGRTVSPYKKHISNGEERAAAISGSDIEEKLRHQIEKRIKEIAEVKFKDTRYIIHRKVHDTCFNWELLSPIVSLIESDKEKTEGGYSLLKPSTEINASGERIIKDEKNNVQIAIRLVGNNIRENSNLITDRDSQGGHRVAPVLVIDKDYNLKTAKFRLNSVKLNAALLPKSMYYTKDKIVTGA